MRVLVFLSFKHFCCYATIPHGLHLVNDLMSCVVSWKPSRDIGGVSFVVCRFSATTKRWNKLKNHKSFYFYNFALFFKENFHPHKQIHHLASNIYSCKRLFNAGSLFSSPEEFRLISIGSNFPVIDTLFDNTS